MCVFIIPVFAEYTRNGRNWYRLYTGNEAANYFDASDRCEDEGGQLAVAHIADQLTEVTDVLTASGKIIHPSCSWYQLMAQKNN